MIDVRAQETLKDLVIRRYDRVSPGDIEHLKTVLTESSQLCRRQYTTADMRMKECDRKKNHLGHCEGDYISYGEIRGQQ